MHIVEGVDGARERCGDGWVAGVIEMLDMALILTGAEGREDVVGAWFEVLEGCVDGAAEERPGKRRRVEEGLPASFPDAIAKVPVLKYPILRSHALGLAAFDAKVALPEMQTPLIIEGAMQHWPAFEEDRAWKNPRYLMRKTLNGRRLVPVEIGRSYTDAGWGQKILSFRDFMREYMLPPDVSSDDLPSRNETSPQSDPPAVDKGYLAQHDLFAQIPSLRADIAIPDYCYTTPAALSSNPSNVTPVAQLDAPQLNAWFGPADTISPLHTDPYHNILAQVVGYKYVRLYPPGETPKLYPRGTQDDGVDMSNTSCVDLDAAMAVWGEISCWEGDGEGEEEKKEKKKTVEQNDVYAFQPCTSAEGDGVAERYPRFRTARYIEGVLGPGECLYVPLGWWHYVRSLTPSFSVSFWWN